ncbi:TonB-dependent receptor [Chitinophaga sp. Mgbs1]|uniref:TonB-dependent receptor n=1 Tax=Chitinophaga solisilvae TaxID=1233460 RepID=A0A3S1AXY8_9BACT|nr:TonB-dependent receptor [Chitinophaga solisilvae]
MRKVILLIVMCLPGMLAMAQQVLKGTVIDSLTRQPVPGATVKVLGTANGATTNEKGEFQLSVPENAKLIISSIGFENMTVPVTLVRLQPVQMRVKAIALTDAVVVGYGSQQRTKVTNAISTVKAGALSAEKNIAGDVGKALQGRVAGVFVASTSGAPGNPPNIQIRGAQSVNAVATNPLIVVDGLVLEGSTVSLNSINPQDIESIDVLKDAASAAIYGARGSSGVIIVTTKKGRVNSKPVLNVNMYTGVNNVPATRHLMNTAEYGALFREARNNRIADIDQQLSSPAGLTPAQISTLQKDKQNAQSQLDGLQLADNSTDWLDRIRHRNAPVSNIQASMSGGGERNNYYMSLGRFAETASMGTGRFERYTGRLDVTQQVNSWLKVNGNINITQSVNRELYNPIGLALAVRPDTPEDPVLNADGSLGYYAGQQQHPLGAMRDNKSRNKANVYLGALSAEVKLLKELQFRSAFNATKYNSLNREFYSPMGYIGAFNKGQFKTSGADNFSWNYDNYFTYNQRFRRLGVNATLGYTFYNNEISAFGFQVNNFPRVDAITGAGAGAEYGSPAALANMNITNREISDAYFMRVGLDLDGKYLFNASLRRDGSSKLLKGNRYSWFPAVSAGWDLAREHFLEKSKIISQLKLRSSYGMSGNIRPLGYFDAQHMLQAKAYNGSPALQISGVVGNPDIRWERTRQVDAGIDMAMFNSRFTMAVDYYNKTTDGLMTATDVSWIYGAASMQDNIGNIRNYGVDLELAYSSRPGRFTWKVETNMNINRNEIISLKDSLTNYGAFTIGGPRTRAKVGQSIGSVQVYESLGVNPATGDMMYKDQNNDGQWNADDMITIPVAMPAFTGGTAITLGYRNFTLEALFNYVAGNKVYDFSEQTLRNYNADATGVMPNKFTNLNDRWKKPGDMTAIPRAVTGPHGEGKTTDWNYRPSTQFVYNASYMRLRNVTLAYAIPAAMLRKVKMSGCRVYTSAQNLLTITKYPGFDPEAAAITGVVSNNLPNPRAMVIGIDLSF